ncbi:MAG: hypothetical protein K2K54_00525 [Lachnospiraceae bacterium]|nr:hypothetical protein [Lachnospiraceae bacterium]
MRIGNWDNSEKTEKLINLIQAEDPKTLTGAKRWKNWWHYHKWYVACGIILLGIAFNLIGNALGLWQKSPDFQIAYVGETELSPDTVAALETIFSSIQELDFNGDGEVTIQINQYPDILPDQDIAYYEFSSEITLIGDISSCESYFFLMDDPARFQKKYQLLANPDGSCPADTDYSADGKTILCSDCPVLFEIASAAETISPGSQAFLSRLYFGRRCFYTGTVSQNAEKCSKLWDYIKTGQTSPLP